MDYPRRELVDHVAGRDNLSLLVPRQISFMPWRHAHVSDLIAESCLISTKTKEGNYNFPLYLYPERNSLVSKTKRRSNLSPQFLRGLCSAIGAKPTSGSDLPEGTTPEDVAHYFYAILHSPAYRERYAEFLKSDFPRLPLPRSVSLFRTLSNLGGNLVSLHLMREPHANTVSASFVGDRSCSVQKVSWTEDTVWIDKAKSVGFSGVGNAVWNYWVGGHQVCDKWLKDRRGRILTDKDTTHYSKIVAAISETIRLMNEIDAVVEKHGGWPGAFVYETPSS